MSGDPYGIHLDEAVFVVDAQCAIATPAWHRDDTSGNPGGRTDGIKLAGVLGRPCRHH